MLEIIKSPFTMLLDVESIGLYGEGFAVAYVVLDGDLNAVQFRIFATSPNVANAVEILNNTIKSREQALADREWVARNVFIPPTDETYWHHSTQGVRTAFWNDWVEWRSRGTTLWADCAYPVESGFLIACVLDDLSRGKDAPYPLYDLSTLLAAHGYDPMATFTRLPAEPRHNPLGDARQSARIFRSLMLGEKIEVE